ANFGYEAGKHTVDTRLDSTDIAALGYVAGNHSNSLDSVDIANFGYEAGKHTVDTRLDSADIAALGYVAGKHTSDSHIDSMGIADMGFITYKQATAISEKDPLYNSSPAAIITNDDISNWNNATTDDNDKSATNEIQILSYNYGILSLSNGGGSINLNIAASHFWVAAPTKTSKYSYSSNPCRSACPEGTAAAADANGYICKSYRGSGGTVVKADTPSYLCGSSLLAQCHCIKI
ncbi:MAG: hypothetical protein WBA74_20270, partial [Cyclobacteriaceae bacterium]